MKKGIISVILAIAVIMFNLQCFGYAKPPQNLDQAGAAFVFPSSLQLIEEEAFEGTFASTIVFPNGFLRVENDAFANNYRLTDAFIPPTTQFISGTTFSSSSNSIIHGVKGSYANEWADEHNVPFVEDNLWNLILYNGTTVVVDKPGTKFILKTVHSDKHTRIASIIKENGESKRPQDRPELNPIDYRFP